MTHTKFLNAKQIMRYTTAASRQHRGNAKLLKLLHEYARYFPMATITKDQIKSSAGIRRYMFSSDLNLDDPAKAKRRSN